MTLRLRYLIALSLSGALGAVAACSSTSTPSASATIGAGEYKGEMSGKGETGIIDVTLSGGSLSPSALRPLDVQDQATAVGSVTVAGKGTFQVTGTFDPDTGTLTLAGYGYTFTGAATSGGINGSYTGPAGAGSFTLIQGSGAQIFCGAYAGQDTGVWNLVVGPTSAAGSIASASGGSTSPLACTVSGASLSCTASNGVTASGTVSGTTASGTWSDGSGHTGTWTGDTGSCPVPQAPDAGSDATSPVDAGAPDVIVPIDGKGGGDAVTPGDATGSPDAPGDSASGADASGTDAATGVDASVDASGGLDASDATVPVDAAPGPVTVTSRDGAGNLASQTWAVWQDGAGAWTPLAPTANGTYHFTPTAATYGVALVCASGDNSTTSGAVIYRTSATTQIDVGASGACAPIAPPGTSYTFGGAMTNILTGAVWLRQGSRNGSGGGQISFTGTGSANYVLYNFYANGPYDIALGLSDTNDQNLLKMLLVRGQSFSANVTRNVDWSTEGFVPGAPNVAKITNATAQTTLSVGYVLAGGGQFGVKTGASALNAGVLTQSFATVTTGQVAGDGYLVDATDYSAATQVTNEVQRSFSSAADVTTALPAAFLPSFSALQTSNYLQPVYSVQSAYAGAQSYAFSWHYGPSKGVAHDFRVDVDPAWLPAGAFVVTFPDFSALTGWVAAWAVPIQDAGAANVTVQGFASSKNAVAGGTESLTSYRNGLVP